MPHPRARQGLRPAPRRKAAASPRTPPQGSGSLGRARSKACTLAARLRPRWAPSARQRISSAPSPQDWHPCRKAASLFRALRKAAARFGARATRRRLRSELPPRGSIHPPDVPRRSGDRHRRLAGHCTPQDGLCLAGTTRLGRPVGLSARQPLRSTGADAKPVAAPCGMGSTGRDARQPVREAAPCPACALRRPDSSAGAGAAQAGDGLDPDLAAAAEDEAGARGVAPGLHHLGEGLDPGGVHGLAGDVADHLEAVAARR